MGFVRHGRNGEQIITAEDLTTEEDVRIDTIISPPRETLYDRLERDPSYLAREFSIRLIELADEFDDLDHEYGPMGGTELQDYCLAARGLARSWPIASPLAREEKL